MAFGLPMNFQVIILVIVLCMFLSGWLIQALMVIWYFLLMFTHSFVVYPKWKNQRRLGNKDANFWKMLEYDIRKNRQ